ncbi:AraC family transcriptional regulator ligand-binding domain-containing protein [Streptomyces sp. NPDC088194]|uniref:AraC family transcriptional regulator ligand-binding domain-containing protein n=1 Tax=Streptomyces sp. NPDC088194 TaxID=3154931 RepID=UPI00344DA9E6
MPPAAPITDLPTSHPHPHPGVTPCPCPPVHQGPAHQKYDGRRGGQGEGGGDNAQGPYGGTARTSVPASLAGAPLTDSVVVPRLIATATANNPREAEQLVRAAGLPHILGQPETTRAPSTRTYRLWGAVLARTGRVDAGLLAAAGYRPGLLDVFDYLMTSAPTVGEGLARGAAHIHLISSNSLLTIDESDDEVTIGYAARHGDDELRWVVAEFALAVLTRQLRHSTGRELSPVRVEFAHRAPLRQAPHQEAFGNARLEFGATADAITLHRQDLERRLDTADPALAAIMLRAAAEMPAPRIPRSVAVPGLREVIAEQLPNGRPSLADAARRLAISTRTLQRRLGDSGTTWRAELDAVRREQSLRHGSAGSAQRAVRLGFAESRSLRRAMNRWDADNRGEGARTDGSTGRGGDHDTGDHSTDGDGTGERSGTPQEAGTA